ncbi:MAG: diguanylate cyclase [Xanthobacteraceae bacterium]|nr:diguanylate cyclase [Xanthobacteraceae bacterium]
MPMIRFADNTSKLKAIFGIRGRLILLALILVVPLMIDRVRLLEQSRAQQVATANIELTELAKHTADSQHEIILTVEAVLKSSAFIYGAESSPEKRCQILRASVRTDLPWIRSMFVLNGDGKVICSNSTRLDGLDLSDRNYFRRAKAGDGFVVSDYIFSRASHLPSIITLYPMLGTVGAEEDYIGASIDLNWVSQLLKRRASRPGMLAVMVDANGVVLATSESGDNKTVGQPLAETNLLSAVVGREIESGMDSGSITFHSTTGERQNVTFARVGGTGALMIVSVNEAVLLADIDHRIRTAYMELALVVLFALLGGWIAGQRLIIRPIRIVADMAERFGRGNLPPSSFTDIKLPREFVPLADAFAGMATQLNRRERDLVATNDRLTVMASVDMVSGLANRRGLQGRLEFEWLKAEQTGGSISMIMIDIDHFKLFNDTYGHLEGDACLRRVGETLAICAAQAAGFAARYGGEEFCLLLPKTDAVAAMEIGERVRAGIETLAIPHGASPFNCVTVSAGIASGAPGQAKSVQELIAAADIALYVAKHRGRNSVVAHGLIRAEDHLAMSMAS